MHLSDFDYHLPPEKIAQVPMHPRDHSRMLVLDRGTQAISDKHFFDLAGMLTPNDVLVLNNTRVFPARLAVLRTAVGPAGQKKPIELLLEKEVGVSAETITWQTLTKPGLKVGDTFEIPGSHVTGVCEAVDGYLRTVTFRIDREQFFSQLDRWAKTPIPPYIRWNRDDEAHLRAVYQTVFAKYTGAMAAPTAGLHFTPELLAKIRARGIQIEEVTLHVGLGTFLPVKTDDITAHSMHSEWFELSPATALALNDAKAAGKRIIAVGTTVVRVLESCAEMTNDQMPDVVRLSPRRAVTSIFIYPPYRFTFVDSLITNFHTPKSTLLMLVSAFVSAPNVPFSRQEPGESIKSEARGHDQRGEVLPPFSTFNSCLIGRAYQHALAHDYRFYSFGDCMWIQ